MLRIVLLILLLPNFALADSLESKSRLCTRYFSIIERRHDIPSKILNAISLVETGTYHPHLKRNIPYPWAINVNGKGYYYNSKKETIKAINDFRKQGYKSIDVGCMQVNLHFHGDNFRSLNHALDPKTNIEVGAKLLKNHYLENGDWKKAVAHYHSKTPEFGTPYSEKVIKNWHVLQKAKYKTERRSFHDTDDEEARRRKLSVIIAD